MKNDEDLKILGDNIRLERLRRKWSQDELAQRAGLSIGAHISRIEHGDIDMQISTLFAILRALNLKLEDLIDLHRQ